MLIWNIIAGGRCCGPPSVKAEPISAGGERERRIFGEVVPLYGVKAGPYGVATEIL